MAALYNLFNFPKQFNLLTLHFIHKLIKFLTLIMNSLKRKIIVNQINKKENE